MAPAPPRETRGDPPPSGEGDKHADAVTDDARHATDQTLEIPLAGDEGGTQAPREKEQGDDETEKVEAEDGEVAPTRIAFARSCLVCIDLRAHGSDPNPVGDPPRAERSRPLVAFELRFVRCWARRIRVLTPLPAP